MRDSRFFVVSSYIFENVLREQLVKNYTLYSCYLFLYQLEIQLKFSSIVVNYFLYLSIRQTKMCEKEVEKKTGKKQKGVARKQKGEQGEKDS